MMVGELLSAWRRHRQISIREAAQCVGIPWSTYQRVENGHAMSGDTLSVILRWMMQG